MKKILLLGLGLFALFFGSFTCAESTLSAPVAMLKTSSDQLIAALAQNKASLKSNPDLVYQIVDKILVPQVDINRMARSVLSRTVWDAATPAQQQQFAAEFKNLIIHTYSSAFANYRDQVVQFLPVRGGVTDQQRLQIDSQILQNQGPTIDVSYRLIKEGNDWKVYDFSVDGISIVQSFRAQFATELSQGNLALLLQKLAKHNNQPVAAA